MSNRVSAWIFGLTMGVALVAGEVCYWLPGVLAACIGIGGFMVVALTAVPFGVSLRRCVDGEGSLRAWWLRPSCEQETER